jgi:hypothetical protein
MHSKAPAVLIVDTVLFHVTVVAEHNWWSLGMHSQAKPIGGHGYKVQQQYRCGGCESESHVHLCMKFCKSNFDFLAGPDDMASAQVQFQELSVHTHSIPLLMKEAGKIGGH